MPNFAANISWLFQEWPFLDRFTAAADAGFSAVEYLFPYDYKPDDIARQLSAHNLRLALFNMPPGDLARGERGLAALPGRQDDFRASVATALDHARATGALRMHLMAGIASGDAALAAYRDSLEYACAAADAEGIGIVIEPLNSRDVPHYLLNDFGMAERIIKDLGLPNLKLQFDIYHRQMIHGGVTRALEALLQVIGHVQVASVPLRQEPMTGELDDAHVFRTLDRLGYAGFVGCEYTPAAGTLQGLGWMRSL